LGGLGGIFLGRPLPTYLHDSYFVVGHHFVIGGVTLLPLRQSITGSQDVRPDDERAIGQDPFWLTLIPFTCFSGHAFIRLGGLTPLLQPCPDYTPLPGMQVQVTGWPWSERSQLIFVQFLLGLRAGESGAESWNATSLE
jgi:heme/copper-type cytochrome/quinol oxidase subunit 1